jgi:hypothetical protein
MFIVIKIWFICRKNTLSKCVQVNFTIDGTLDASVLGSEPDLVASSGLSLRNSRQQLIGFCVDGTQYTGV